jgi:hypothetical protein
VDKKGDGTESQNFKGKKVQYKTDDSVNSDEYREVSIHTKALSDERCFHDI